MSDFRRVQERGAGPLRHGKERCRGLDRHQSEVAARRPLLGEHNDQSIDAKLNAAFVTLHVYNAAGKEKTMQAEVFAGRSLTAQGTPVISVADPAGGGSRNLEIIRDGEYADNPAQCFDTYRPGKAEGAHEYVGYLFDREQEFSALAYQEGYHFGDNGWFEGGVRVQVLQNGVWKDVAATASPAYDGTGWGSNSYGIYHFDFAPVKGSGIRLYGVAGDASRFISVAELQVY